MYKVLDKDIIRNEILPHLSTTKRGFETKSCLIEVINSILYKLKTGIQWHMLPVRLWNNCQYRFKLSKWSENEYILFDDGLYEQRYTIERTNAWMNSYRTLLNRF